MKKLKEMEFFSTLLENSNNELTQKAVSDGRKAIGYNCSMVPEPLLSVDGLFPVCLRAPEISDTETANFYLSPFNCSYSRSLLQNNMDGNYDFISGFVFADSCVHIDRVEHNMRLDPRESRPLCMLAVPKKDYPAGMEAFAKDLRALGESLAKTFGVDTGDESVRAAIRKHNECMKLLQEIADLRLEDNPKITGAEWHTVYAATKAAPKDLLLEPLKALMAALMKREPDSSSLPRVMVLGSDIDNPAFTALFEAQGCRVVADRYCFGSLPGMELIQEDGDPYRNLAEYCVRDSQCPRMIERSDDRLAYMLKLTQDYRVDGIIFEVMKFCDLWGWEVIKCEKAAAEAGIPYVKFEREYQFAGEGQLRTRVQAFIERLRNRATDEQIRNGGEKQC